MEELKELWRTVDAYVSHLEFRFKLCAVYLWSIHNYLAYKKFVDWCVHTQLNCPICSDRRHFDCSGCHHHTACHHTGIVVSGIADISDSKIIVPSLLMSAAHHYYIEAHRDQPL
jgi:hypothetical protein